ncbi:hypothetical protein LSAT2_020813, partial [Lamellibrachia satsuma]
LLLEAPPGKFTECDLSDRYDRIHVSAGPDIPKRCSNRLSRMSWSTVSKAADMSSSTRITPHRRSSASGMSF